MESTPVFVKGGLVLRATPAALSFPRPLPGARAKAAEKVEAEARAHVISQGGDPSADLLVLSQHRMQFGKYWGQTFKWLLENDVGYTLPLVHSHQQERERSSSQSALMANKDALTRYSHAFPEFVEELRFHKACDAARVRASQPGREGEALVGFGQYKWELLRDLYDSKDKERVGITPPQGSNTGELLGVEYLYSQTGRVLQDASVDPDVPDEEAAIQELDVDEGFGEAADDLDDPTLYVELPLPDPSSSSSAAATRSGVPAGAPKSGPSDPSAPLDGDSNNPPEAAELDAPQNSSSDTEEECQGPDGQPGYQHVCRLAEALVEVRNLLRLTDSRVDRLIELWQALPEPDKERLVYPARHQERLVKGRFKATKSPGIAGRESLKRGMLGSASGPSSWPSTSRIVEAICVRLCHLHPSAAQSGGVKRTRWSLVRSDYAAIRDAVLNSPRLMAQTNLQLFELNQRTISQWYCVRERDREGAILQQGLDVAPRPSLAAQPLPATRPLRFQQEGHRQPFQFETPQDLARQAIPQRQPAPAPILPAQPPASTALSQDNVGEPPHPPPPPAPSETVPRTTAWRKRKKEEAAGDTDQPQKARKLFTCRKCGLPKRKDTGHSRFGSSSFCSVASGGKSVEAWLAEQRDAKGRGDDGH